jgi:ferritin
MKSTKPIKPIILQQSTINLINESIGYEYKSHLFWNAAANWCATVGYNKAAAYYAKESKSELKHVKKHQDFLIGWNVVPIVPQVEMSYDFESLPDTINKSYTLMLDIFNHYVKSSQPLFSADLSTFDYLQEFRLIQVEALNVYSNFLSGLELINTDNKLDILFFEDKFFA